MFVRDMSRTRISVIFCGYIAVFVLTRQFQLKFSPPHSTDSLENATYCDANMYYYLGVPSTCFRQIIRN